MASYKVFSISAIIVLILLLFLGQSIIVIIGALIGLFVINFIFQSESFSEQDIQNILSIDKSSEDSRFGKNKRVSYQDFSDSNTRRDLKQNNDNLDMGF